MAQRPSKSDKILAETLALYNQGQIDAAIVTLTAKKGVALKSVVGLNFYGVLLARKGDPKKAVSYYDKALRADPKFADAYNNRGNALRALGRLDEALKSYEGAIKHRPTMVEAHNNRAVVLQALGRYEAALASCDQALKLQPTHGEALYHRGLALHELGRLEDALAAFDEVLARQPAFAEALSARGNALRAKGDIEAAVAAYDMAVAQRPDYAEAYSNRGNALRELGRLDDALASCDHALDLQPNHPEALLNRGTTLQDMGRVEEAITAFDQALALRSDYAEARFSRGLAKLLSDDYAGGWADYECRWGVKNFSSKRRDFEQPLWDGAGASGKRLLVHAEQGLGDTLMFARFLPRVRAQGATVLFECPAELARLLQDIDGIDQLIPRGHDLPEFDCHAPLMSLPRLLGSESETLATRVPYVRSPGEMSLDDTVDSALRVGLVWQGQRRHLNDRNRSITPQRFLPLLQVANCRFFSLQVGDAPRTDDQLWQERVIDLAPRLRDFADTADLLDQLDLLISVDTSVVHLAGAMGKPAWLLLPFAPDWRWLTERRDSPWYPSLHLFRQPAVGDWDSVFAAVGSELKNLAQAHRDT